MLSGQPAFAGENLAQVVFKVVFEDPAPLAQIAPGVPPDVRHAIEKALAKDPAQRFADVTSFVAALTGRPMHSLERGAAPAPAGEAFAATMQSGNPPPATTPSFRGEVTAPKPPRRGRKTIIPVAIALFGAAVAILVARGQRNDDAPRATATTERPAVVPAATPPAPPPEPVAVTPPPDAGRPAVATPPPPPRKDDDDSRAEESEPETVRADLDAAKDAIDAKDWKKALFLIDRALKKRNAARGQMLKLMAYCGKGDLSMANAQLHSIRKGDLKRAKKKCAEMGLELQ
jgi:hypothetical protein